MIGILYIIMAVSISVVIHPFPQLISWKRMLTYNIYNDPMYHAAIPNGSRMEVGLLPKNATTAYIKGIATLESK